MYLVQYKAVGDKKRNNKNPFPEFVCNLSCLLYHSHLLFSCCFKVFKMGNIGIKKSTSYSLKCCTDIRFYFYHCLFY